MADSEGVRTPNPAEVATNAVSPRLLLTFALLSTFAAYARTLKFQFVYDDQTIILANPAVQSWRYLPQYFTRHFWAGVYPQGPGNYYRPVFLLWLRLNYMAFGTHAWAWHLASIFLHLTATLLVYFLARRLLQDEWSAALAALIFGLHPVHIEPVAWVSGSTDPLLAILLIGSFLCFLKAREPLAKRRRWMVPSLFLFALALLDKEIAIVLPALIFAYQWFYGSPSPAKAPVPWLQRIRPARRAAIPYLLLVCPYLAVRVWVLKGFSHVETNLPVATMIFTWPSLFWFWVKHLLWPAGLATFYDLPTVNHPGVGNFVLPAIGTLAVAGMVVWWARRSGEVAFAAAWLMLPLLPFLNLRLFVQSDYGHDRYLYLSSVGFAIIAACALRGLWLGHTKVRGMPAISLAGIVGIAALLGYSTERQSAYFQNDLVFYRHNVEAAPHNMYAKLFYAVVLGNMDRYGEAIPLLHQALEIDPEFWGANYNLGYTYYRLGDVDKAQRYLMKAAQIDPNKAGAFFYLGLTQLKLNQLDDAATAIRRAILIQPDGYGYHYALGIILKLEGDLPGALAQFQTEFQMNPAETAAQRQMAEIEASGQTGSPRHP